MTQEELDRLKSLVEAGEGLSLDIRCLKVSLLGVEKCSALKITAPSTPGEAGFYLEVTQAKDERLLEILKCAVKVHYQEKLAELEQQFADLQILC